MLNKLLAVFSVLSLSMFCQTLIEREKKKVSLVRCILCPHITFFVW